MQGAILEQTSSRQRASSGSVASRIDDLKRELLRRTVADRLERSLPLKVRPLLVPMRYKGLHGGRGSAKSQSFARMLIARCKRNLGTRWLCGREVQISLEHSVKQTLVDLIKEYDLESDFEILQTQIRTPGDGKIVFQGLLNNTAESLKSLEGFDGAWIEEAQAISKRSLQLLIPTIRKEQSEIWFSWNPEEPNDPVEFLRTAPPNDAVVVEMNWQDNPYFPNVLRDELERAYAHDPDTAGHVWGGKYIQRSESAVFHNWKVAPFDTPPKTLFLFGGDWGFSIDPTVLVRVWVDPSNDRRLFIDREVYQVGCEIDDTPALFDKIDPEHPNMARQWVIRADSARPETISYLQRHGYPRIEPAKKGPGSVEEGVKFLQNFNEIIIHPRCSNTIREFGSYRYKVNPKTLDVTPLLQDKENHVIDSVRYATESLRRAEEYEFTTW